MYLNQLTIIGFTGQDADFHFSSNGTPVTTLSVATKESWKDAAGDWQGHTEWHRIVAFGKLAEYAKTLTKGTHVMWFRARCVRESTKRMVSRAAFLKSGPRRSRNWIVSNVEERRDLLRADRWKRTASTARFSQMDIESNGEGQINGANRTCWRKKTIRPDVINVRVVFWCGTSGEMSPANIGE